MAYSVETLKSWRRDAKSKRKTNKRRRDAVRKPYDNGWKMDDYYSKIKKKVDDCTSELENGMIMGIRHKEYDINGMQFHPESILTPMGREMVNNWIKSIK